jgi:hypothetical protein
MANILDILSPEFEQITANPEKRINMLFFEKVLTEMTDHCFVLGFAHYLHKQNLFPKEILLGMHKCDAKKELSGIFPLYAAGLKDKNAYLILNKAMDFCGTWYMDKQRNLKLYAYMLFGLQPLGIEGDKFTGGLLSREYLVSFVNKMGSNYVLTRKGLAGTVGLGNRFNDLAFLHVVDIPIVVVPSELEQIAELYGWPTQDANSTDITVIEDAFKAMQGGKAVFMGLQGTQCQEDLLIQVGKCYAEHLPEKEKKTREELARIVDDYESKNCGLDEAEQRINKLVGALIRRPVFRENGYVGCSMSMRAMARREFYKNFGGVGEEWETTTR